MKKYSLLFLLVILSVSCQLDGKTVTKKEPDIKAEFMLNPRNIDNMLEVLPKFPYGEYKLPFSNEYVKNQKIKSIKRFNPNAPSEYTRFEFDQEGKLSKILVESEDADFDKQITFNVYHQNEMSYTEKSTFFNVPITSICTYHYNKYDWITTYEVKDPDDATQNKIGSNESWELGTLLLERSKSEAINLTFYVDEKYLLKTDDEIENQINLYLKNLLKDQKAELIACCFPKLNDVERRINYYWSVKSKQLEKIGIVSEIYNRGIYMGSESKISSIDEVDHSLKISYDEHYFPIQLKIQSSGLGSTNYHLIWENKLLREVRKIETNSGSGDEAIVYQYELYP